MPDEIRHALDEMSDATCALRSARVFCRGMKAASIKEIKSELQSIDADVVLELCMRLAKYKKESKELLTYLLFDAQNESGYVETIKEEMDTMFTDVQLRNTYLLKKTLRKILRFANKQIRYSGVKQTELDVRIYFCINVRKHRVPYTSNVVLGNIYFQQIKKIKSTLAKLPEDLQGDYERDLEKIL